MEEKNNNYSIRKDIAEGVYLLFSHLAVKAVVVAETIAKKFLSQPAQSRGIKNAKGELVYPAENGLSSIPMFELSSKKYLDLNTNQIKQHWNNLVKNIPEYLREKGFLNPRKVPVLSDKIDDELKEYESTLKYIPRKEFLRRAKEITEFQEIAKYYQSSDFPADKQGVLLSVPNLVDTTLKYVHDHNLTTNQHDLNTASLDIKENFAELIAPEDGYCVDKAVACFNAELKVAKQSPFNSVALQLIEGEKTTDFNLSLEQFEGYLSDEFKARFSKERMADFPEPDYFGDKYVDLYHVLFRKRFEENIQDYFNEFAQKGNVKLMVKYPSEEKIESSNYNELIGVVNMKKYVEANYSKVDADKCLNNMKSIIEKNKNVINSVTQMISDSEKIPELKNETYNNYHDSSEHSMSFLPYGTFSSNNTKEIQPEKQAEQVVEETKVTEEIQYEEI